MLNFLFLKGKSFLTISEIIFNDEGLAASLLDGDVICTASLIPCLELNLKPEDDTKR